ncbi:MAG TPA: tetratricopeptide repeat protein, partial [Oceanipulchritudo sp.]|nr:tetratricopeptide repeat protein [Oceanipulchritudo sp.]
QLLLAKARLKLQQGKTVEGLREAEEARVLAAGSGDFRVQTRILLTLGNAFILLRDYPEALDFFEEALRNSETLKDPALQARTLNSIAIAYWRMRQWEEAEAYLRQAQQLHPENSTMHYLFSNNIGVAVMEQGRYEEAERALLKALEHNRENRSLRETALNYSNLGDLYRRMNRPRDALGYLEKALESEETSEMRYVLTRSHRHMARVLQDLGQPEEAIRHCRLAIDMARRMEDRAEEMDSWETLIFLMESAGRHREALEAFRKMNAIEEDILSRQTRLRSALFSARFASAETQAKVAVLQKEKDLQALQRNTILVFLLVAIIVALVLGNRYRVQNRLTRQLRIQKEEIEKSHHSLTRAHRRLSRLNREKDEILGIAAHDLRNPLGAIRQLAVMVRDETDFSDEDRLDLLNGIVTSSESVLAIVGKLLDINRLEEGVVKVHWNRIDPLKLVNSVCRHYSASASQKNQSVHINSQPGLELLDGDWTLVHQAMGNLLSNAIKYSPLGADIEVAISRIAEKDALRFSVRDNGPGISTSDQEKLFRKFSRLSAKPTGGESSTGLGLFIVRKLVELMKGRILCESTLGVGTTFHLELPLRHEASVDLA